MEGKGRMQRWGWSVLALCLAGTAMAEEPIRVELTSDKNVTFRFPEAMQTLATFGRPQPL